MYPQEGMMANSTAIGESLQSREKRKRDREHFEVIITSEPALLVMVQGEPPYIPEFQLGDLNARNLQLVELLEELRLDVQERGVDLTDYDHDYLSRLRSPGVAAYNKIISGKFRGALERARGDEQRELSLTFRTPPHMSFLWEMIYAGKRGGPVEPELFWGFRYPIGRAFILEKIQHPSEIRPWHGIFSAIHEDLPFSRPEVKRLEDYLVRIRKEYHLEELKLRLLDDEFPTPPLSCDQLMERFVSEDFRYGIIHFACHCENPEDGGAQEASLLLKAHGHKLVMRYQTLEEWLGEGKGDGSFSNRPFVFLNACESQTIGHLLETSNFPEGFLRFRASGVIATACTVPDEFANAFSTEFYRRLLKLNEEDGKGKRDAGARPVDSGDGQSEDTGASPASFTSNVGEVLLETRLHFLDTYNNPLGLAYGLYALSNQRLRLRD
jgi:hypothetical protein